MGYKEKDADPLSSAVQGAVEVAGMMKGALGKETLFRKKIKTETATGGAAKPSEQLAKRAATPTKDATKEQSQAQIIVSPDVGMRPATHEVQEMQNLQGKLQEAAMREHKLQYKQLSLNAKLALLQEQASESLDREGEVLLENLQKLQKIQWEKPAPEQLKEIKSAFVTTPKTYELQGLNRAVFREVQSQVFSHIASEQNLPGYGLTESDRNEVAEVVGMPEFWGATAPKGPTKGEDFRWDSKTEKLPKGKAYESLRRKLETFNVRAARLGGAALDREIFEAWHDITEEPIDQLDKIPNFLQRLGERLNELSESQRREGRGWSSLWVTEPVQQRYFLNSFLEVRRTQDRLSRETMLLDNRFKQSVEHQFQQHIGFLESEDFRTNGVRFYKDRGNWERISRETGFRIDGTRGHSPEDHPIYKQFTDNRQYEKLRSELVKQLNASDMLQRNFVSWELGKQEEMGVGLGGFAEPGIMAVLNDRGFNTDAFDTIERLGEHILYGYDGKVINVSGPVLQRLKNDAFRQLWDFQRDKLQAKFQEKYGARAVLSEQDVKASVDEMYMLAVVTGRRSEWSMRGLAPQQSGGRGTNPHQYAGELGGDAKIKQAQRPFTDLELRWNTASDVGKASIEEFANLHARRLGIDKELGQMVQQQDERSEEYRNLVKIAFSITNEHDPEEVKKDLGVFTFNRNGDKIVPPEKINEVSKDYLLRKLILRKGLQTGEPGAMAGYGYFGSGWNRSEIIRSYEEIFGKNLAIGLHERTLNEVAKLFDPEVVDHKKMEEIRDALTRVDPDHPLEEGMLVAMSRYSPTHVWESLYANREQQSVEFFNASADDLNIFQYGKETTTPITKDRQDLFVKRFLLRQRLINKALADWEDPRYARLPVDYPNRLRHRGLSPIDYSRDVTDPRQRAIVKEWCRRTHVDPDAFLRVGKKFADFALKPEVLKEASDPVNASFFLSVHALDPRFHRVDDFSKLWQDQETGEWLDKRKEEIGPWAQRIANSNGYGAGAGLGRWVGDQVNVWKVIVPHLSFLIDAKNPKEFEEHLEPFVETIKMTGGGGAKALTAETFYYTHVKMNQLDFWKDMLGMGGENSTTMDSIAQRIGGKGFHVVTMRDADELEHHAEAVAGMKFHNFTPHFAHESKLELKQIWRPIPGQDIEIPMIWVYRFWALGGLVGLGGGIALLSKMWDDFKSGISGQSSQSEH